jgi:nicotinamidase-related amidase
MPSAITISDQDVLLAIDLQADFMPGGALAVEDGDAIVPLINALARRFAHVAVTQDWHPAAHASFASSMKARRASKLGVSPMASRRCGRTIAFRAPRELSSIRT